MTLITMLLLGWCLLSLPVGIVVGNLLRGPRTQPALKRGDVGPTVGLAASRARVAA